MMLPFLSFVSQPSVVQFACFPTTREDVTVRSFFLLFLLFFTLIAEGGVTAAESLE